MNRVNQGFDKLKLNPDEYCTILEKNNTSQVKVNKLMPIMATGKPKNLPYSLPKRITCNASECEPIGSSQCITKNYMTIKGGAAEVLPGDIGLLHVINGNIKEISFIEVV